MEINVTLGHDSDNGVCVTVADDNTYTPEVVADLLSRAVQVQRHYAYTRRSTR